MQNDLENNGYKENFQELVNSELNNPVSVKTSRVIKTNDRYSILEKADGTFTIRKEFDNKEYGHYLTWEEAYDDYLSILEDEKDDVEGK